MFGVVVATHGAVAVALRDAAEAMSGPIPRLATLSVTPGADPGELTKTLQAHLDALDDGDGVLVLTDVLGGTPCNLGLTSVGHRAEVVAGVNLPMLLHVAALRDLGKSAADAASELVGYGRDHISNASELLRARRAGRPGGAS